MSHIAPTLLSLARKLTITAALILPTGVLASDESDLAQLQATKACENCDLSESDLRRAELAAASLAGTRRPV